jgi:hypothetical protein
MAKEERNQKMKEAEYTMKSEQPADNSTPPPPPPPSSTKSTENPVLKSTPVTDKPTFHVNPKFIKKKDAEKNQSALK